jgi:type III restriction enzyme
VDEAHKAGTNLSFDMLAALRPSCIVEFTATPSTDPRNGSNVLFRASAAEVKAAEMIKLPIVLTEHPDWRAAVHDAIETRARLAETAKSDARYIRPLTLFQAQDKGQEVTVEVLKKYLIDNENIAPDKIAVATGEQRELDSLNLFDPAMSRLNSSSPLRRSRKAGIVPSPMSCAPWRTSAALPTSSSC